MSDWTVIEKKDQDRIWDFFREFLVELVDHERLADAALTSPDLVDLEDLDLVMRRLLTSGREDAFQNRVVGHMRGLVGDLTQEESWHKDTAKAKNWEMTVTPQPSMPRKSQDE